MGLCGTINLLLWFKKKYCSAHKYNSCNIRQCSGDCLLSKLASFFFQLKTTLITCIWVNVMWIPLPPPPHLHLSLLTCLLAPKRSCILPQVISETAVKVRWPFLPWLPLCIKLNPHSLTHCLCSSQSHSNSFSTLITDKHVDTRHSLVGEFSNYTLTAWANFNSDIKGNLLFL